jgi:ParB family chromosome partitioning protein
MTDAKPTPKPAVKPTPPRSNLGRGLSALFGDTGGEAYGGPSTDRPAHAVAVAQLHPGRFQPRRHFDDGAIDGLVESIRERGILQPLLVRPHTVFPDQYEIIAGERRWRAAQRAGLHEVPVVLRRLSDREALEVALVENIQRQDLTALEEAEGYRRLMDEFGHTQEALGRALGKSRSHIANTLRLLGLPEAVRAHLEHNRLSAGHARALLGALPLGEAVISQLADDVVNRGLNVRQTEQLVREALDRPSPASPTDKAESTRKTKDPDTIALERDLTGKLGLKVTVNPDGNGGRIMIEYRSLDQLDEVIRRLG